MTPQLRRPASLVWTLLGVGLALHVAHSAFGIPGGHRAFDEVVYNVLLVGAAALCVARAVLVPAERAPWLLIGGGLAAWCAADLYWTFALAGLEAPPYPSISDAGWLVFYPTLYVGVVLLLRARGMHFDRSQWLDGLIAALATAAVVAAVVFPPILATSLEGSAAAIAVNLAYPVGDLLLLCLLMGVYALMGWRPDRTWIALGVGLVLNAAADMLYLYDVAQGSYQEHGVMTSLWPAASLATAYAAWQPRRATPIRVAGMRVLVLPGLFALAGFAVLAWDHFDRVSHLAAGLAIAALLAVFARVALTFREHLDLLVESRTEAHTDPLTGLGNRRQLTIDLEGALRACSPREPRVLLLFDLNGFKAYNDLYGHPAGDALLCRLGQRLVTAAAPDGLAYRMGGDEFCVLARPADGDATVLIAACLAALSDRGDGFDVTAAYGACELGDPALDVSEALRTADRAMYAQKDSSRESAGGQSMEVLVRVICERNGDLGHHVDDVASLCEAVAEELGLDDADRTAIARAGVLHDIGKAAIPDAILDKPGPLNEEEWSFMRRHTITGERILLGAPALGHVARLVRASHERYDGSGYPDGLAGEEIPLGARVIAVCDAYDAMVSVRPYAPAMTSEAAVAELWRCAGTQFDPDVVRAFCALLERDAAGRGAARASS